jgi:hypothetical protein
MPRQDQERQTMLEPKRMAYAKSEIEKKGYTVFEASDTQLVFEHDMGHLIYFFPYSGWHSGSTIKDGRGLKKLLQQI